MLSVRRAQSTVVIHAQRWLRRIKYETCVKKLAEVHASFSTAAVPILRSKPSSEPTRDLTIREACRSILLAVIMVHPKGFEPPTFGTGNQRSIQLSYGCMLLV